MSCRTLVLFFLLTNILYAADTDLDRRFTQTVRPFLASYCTTCHSGSTPAAQFDLKPYDSTAAVVKDYPRWNLVLDKLAAKEMPPKPVKQPDDKDRQAVIDWIQQVRTEEARKHAGDPGPVLARRLSNAEYNYSIRDLTGVDMKPTREFPVDPANPAGFDNSGESLTMSPALLNKYLQAARDVANHLALVPDGFVFAPYPQLVETDREKFAIQRIVSFYESRPTDYADYFEAAYRYKHRPRKDRPMSLYAADAKISPKYLPIVYDLVEKPMDVGPVARLQKMWHELTPENLRPQCEAMRDYVKRIRKVTAMEFASPLVQGLYPTSQPLMNWKLREFAANRRHSDPKALRLDTDPPLQTQAPGRYPGLGQEAAVRAAILMAKARAAEPELVVPAGQRDRYQASFERLANVFPDAFYIKERGRFYPDDSQDKGRLLSAGYHNVMGYFRDDTPLIELILSENEKSQLDRLWTEFDFMADYTGRTWVQYYFNQSGEVQGKGRESGTARA
jgi:hypothetical protein